jgi:adenylate cyclase
VSLAVLLLSRTNLLRTFELRTLDGRFLLRGERPSTSPVSVVFIGDDSIGALGRWPWPWDYHALLIDVLTRAGAKAVLFDILFTESPGAGADTLLGMAARVSGKAYFCSYFEADSKAPADRPGTRLAQAGAIHLPLAAIRESAAGVGHCVAWPDIDGNTRRYPLAVRHGDDLHPSLPLLAAAASLGITPDRYDLSRPGSILLPVAGNPVSIPVDAEGLTQIDFTGGIGTFPSYSFAEVLQADQFPDRAPFDLSVFRDRIVLVGATFTGNTDMRPTPFSSAFPMLLIQASAIDDILSGRFIRHAPAPLVILLWLVSGTLLGGLVFIFRPLVSAAVGLAAGLSYLGASIILFNRFRLQVDLIGPLLTVALVQIAVVTMRHFIEDRQAREIRGIFSAYVSDVVVDRIIANPELARLGGERREVTILFCDIRGFTTYAEQNSPEEVVAVLNEYFGMTTEVILKWEGTLDKFIGDAVMAFWNAPVQQRNHAERAVRCALDMARGMDELRRKWAAEGKTALDFGIGLNTGEVLVGNVGAERKMDYTVIGDHVNLAARVESLNKEYGSRILVTEETARRCPGLLDGTAFGHLEVEVTSVGAVTVKGKSRPVTIFRLLGLAHPTPPA